MSSAYLSSLFLPLFVFLFFFFNDTATTEIYTLSLHDALPILLWLAPHLRNAIHRLHRLRVQSDYQFRRQRALLVERANDEVRSEEHTSELQSHLNLVCRLLLEKKKTASHGFNRDSVAACDTLS